MPVVAGVDSSTQSCTVVLRDADDGRLLGGASAKHPPTTPPVSEQDPAAWWSALASATAQLGTGQAAGDLRIGEAAAISVGAQAHGLVPLDAAGEVIRPAKLWNDTTSAPEARELVALLGPADWARRTGSVPVSAFTVTKLLWLARHEPDNFARLAQVLLPHDWLTRELCGLSVTDRSGASGTCYFSPADSAWEPSVLALIDDQADWLPRLPTIRGPEERAGEVTKEAAAAIGIRAGAVVGPGAGDNMGAALGLGLEPGDVVISLGTSGTVYAVHSRPTADETGAVCGNADAAGGYLPLVCTLNATKVTDAVARLLGASHAELAALALAAPGDGRRPVLAAFFDGERTPNRPGASGILGGLRSDVTREQVARAAFEGVLAGLVAGMDALARLGVDTSGRLILTGGGARSAAYRQLTADLTGRPVYTVALGESVAAGAAIQAAAVLHGTPVTDLVKAWAPGATVVAEPRPGQDAESFLDRYRRLAASTELDENPDE
ncbi:MAG: xylulokinase [Cryptosporangiaceae bacterium]|nr:xylulokinase [Cryptosporangiaceae bacterium]